MLGITYLVNTDLYFHIIGSGGSASGRGLAFEREHLVIDQKVSRQSASVLRSLGSKGNPNQLRAIDFVVRSMIAIDLALLILTFIPAFFGTGPAPGLADRWWGRYRIGFWKIDVVWMCVTSIGILVGGLRPTVERGSERTTSKLALAWIPCFFVYVGYIVMHMF